jgi:hypothetical protein
VAVATLSKGRSQDASVLALGQFEQLLARGSAGGCEANVDQRTLSGHLLPFASGRRLAR